MPTTGYKAFEALGPSFEVVMKGLEGLVDGNHFFETFADDAVYESSSHFPGWPMTLKGKDNLMTNPSGYGKTIKLHSGDKLVVYRSQNNCVVILEYEVHGKILSSGAPRTERLSTGETIWALYLPGRR